MRRSRRSRNQMLHLFLALSAFSAPQDIDRIAIKILGELTTHRVVAIGEGIGIPKALSEFGILLERGEISRCKADLRLR